MLMLAFAAVQTDVRTAHAADKEVDLKPVGGKTQEGKPSKPTKVQWKVNGVNKLVWTFRNETKKQINDLHVRNVEYKDAEGNWQKAKISAIETWEVDDDSSWMDGGPVDGGSGANAETENGEQLGEGKKLKVAITLIPAQDEGTQVRCEFYGTDAGDMVCNTAAREIGPGPGRTLLSNLGIPDFNGATKEISEEATSATLNDICLAECDGYRFENGSLVFTPDNSTRFAIDSESPPEILVYNEDGDVAGGGVFGVSNPRINNEGAFVIDVTRDQAAEKHVVVVVRGLQLAGINLNAGEEVYCAVGCTAIGGAHLTNMWKVAVITE